MSTENFVEFQKALSADPALAEKVRALQSEPLEVAVEKLSAMASSAGYPVTTEEVDAFLKSGISLTDEELEKVAGGMEFFNFSPGFAGGVRVPIPGEEMNTGEVSGSLSPKGISVMTVGEDGSLKLLRRW